MSVCNMMLIKLPKTIYLLKKVRLSSVLGLYCFVLVHLIRIFSLFVFRVVRIVSEVLISWSGQGLFWSFITLFVSIFVLFVPIEFFSEYFIENRSFRNLLTNIISVIFVSLFFLILFQILLRNQNVFINEYLSIARAVSFSGFIAIPLVLFLFHNFGKNLSFINNYSYSLILINLDYFHSNLFVTYILFTGLFPKQDITF